MGCISVGWYSACMKHKPDVVVHACNSSTGISRGRRIKVQGLPPVWGGGDKVVSTVMECDRERRRSRSPCCGLGKIERVSSAGRVWVGESMMGGRLETQEHPWYGVSLTLELCPMGSAGLTKMSG